MPRFHMAKYIRLKRDGFIYDYSQQLEAREDVEVFEFDGPVPQNIPNLVEFLGAAKDDADGKLSRRKPKPE